MGLIDTKGTIKRGRVRVNPRYRKYIFTDRICTDVGMSLTIVNGRYKSIKAVCADGRIRVVTLYDSQHYYYLRGYLDFARNVKIVGYVDTTSMTERHGNCPYVFYPDPNSVYRDLLPNWVIPGHEWGGDHSMS